MKKNKSKLDKLNSEDREKYLVFSKMGKLKIIAAVLFVLSAALFVAGFIWKYLIFMIAGAVLLTVFAIVMFLYSNVKVKWERLMKDSRKKSKK